MVTPIPHRGHSYHRQRQTGTAAMVIRTIVSDKPVRLRWSFQLPHRGHSYHHQRRTGTAAMVSRTIVRDKPVRLRWSIQKLIVVICTIVRDEPVRQLWSLQYLIVAIRTIVRDKPVRQQLSFVPSSATNRYGCDGQSYHRQRQTGTAAMVNPKAHRGHLYHR